MSAARADWLARRRELVTASDVAAILGFDPRRGPLAVFAEKVGAIETVEEAYMRRARRLEPVVAAEYVDATGRLVHEPPPFEIVVHPDLPWLGATLDRRTCGSAQRPAPAPVGPDEWGPLELKVGLGWAHREEWEDDAPIGYQVQLQIQAECTGSEWGSLACLLGLDADAPIVRDYLRNDAFLAEAIPRLEEFHRRVQRREPPPDVDARPATTRALRALYPTGNGKTVALDHDALAMADAVENAKSAARADEAKAKTYENALRLKLGDASFAWLPDGSLLHLQGESRIYRRKYGIRRSS